MIFSTDVRLFGYFELHILLVLVCFFSCISRSMLSQITLILSPYVWGNVLSRNQDCHAYSPSPRIQQKVYVFHIDNEKSASQQLISSVSHFGGISALIFVSKCSGSFSSYLEAFSRNNMQWACAKTLLWDSIIRSYAMTSPNIFLTWIQYSTSWLVVSFGTRAHKGRDGSQLSDFVTPPY